jgi:hypothetical protein
MAELATEKQRNMIVSKRRSTAWFEKLPKNMSDGQIIQLVCNEHSVSWGTLTKKEASDIIDHLMQKGGRACRQTAFMNRRKRYYQGQTIIGKKPSPE